MNAGLHAVRLGIPRGWTEFKQMVSGVQELVWTVVFSGILVAVLVFQRGSMIEGTSLAMLTLPGLLGMLIAQGGYTGIVSDLARHREDGTLLRAKAIPNGMVGYLVSQIVQATITTLFNMLVIFVAALFLLDGLVDAGVSGWLTVLLVLVLGLLATLPWGAIVGSLVSSSSGFGLSFLPLAALVAISGIFYPITALPGWVQGIAQVFPVYWLGLGMRSGLLPDSVAAAEIGDSWRYPLMVGVLGVWAVVGLVLAPMVLRRMARRESGGDLEKRKQRALHRGY